MTVLSPTEEFFRVFLKKLLELLATNDSSSERRDIFVSVLLKLSLVLIVLQLAWVCTSPKLSWILQSDLAPFPGCQDSCDIFWNGLAGSVISCYSTVLSARQEIFSDFLIFSNLLKYLTISHKTSCNNYFIVKCLSKSNSAKVVLLTNCIKLA